MRIIDPREQRRPTTRVTESVTLERWTPGYTKPRPICGVPLSYLGEPCARRPGHGWEHRSEYALENARIARSGMT